MSTIRVKKVDNLTDSIDQEALTEMQRKMKYKKMGIKNAMSRHSRQMELARNRLDSNFSEYLEQDEIIRLLKISHDIEENPSQLHCKCKHKDAPHTPDFDLNVFVNRIKQMKIEDNPRRLCSSLIATLDAISTDLTEDNINTLRELLPKIVDILHSVEKERNRTTSMDKEEIKEFEKSCLVSTCMTDEFWTDIILQNRLHSITRKEQNKRNNFSIDDIDIDFL